MAGFGHRARVSNSFAAPDKEFPNGHMDELGHVVEYLILYVLWSHYILTSEKY